MKKALIAIFILLTIGIVSGLYITKSIEVNPVTLIDLTSLDIPDGYPDFEIKKRIIKKQFHGKKADLVIIAFEQEGNLPYKYSFIAPYNYSKRDNSLSPIYIKESDRLWHYSIGKLTKDAVTISFSRCTECDDDGNDYDIELIYNKDSGMWILSQENK